jgi:hypothetical protein
MWWTSSCGRIELNITLNNAKKACHTGECEMDVIALSEKVSIKRQTKLIDKDILSSVLSEYGAWDQSDLKDHQQNIIRLLWLACGDLVDDYD